MAEAERKQVTRELERLGWTHDPISGKFRNATNEEPELKDVLGMVPASAPDVPKDGPPKTG
jgi:hypothetical protein